MTLLVSSGLEYNIAGNQPFRELIFLAKTASDFLLGERTPIKHGAGAKSLCMKVSLGTESRRDG
jgi:hypothetical protein